jgi:hypothetical protein
MTVLPRRLTIGKRISGGVSPRAEPHGRDRRFLGLFQRSVVLPFCARSSEG